MNEDIPYDPSCKCCPDCAKRGRRIYGWRAERIVDVMGFVFPKPVAECYLGHTWELGRGIERTSILADDMNISEYENFVMRATKIALETLQIEERWTNWAVSYIGGNRDYAEMLRVNANPPSERIQGVLGLPVCETAEMITSAAICLETYKRAIENASELNGMPLDKHFGEQVELARANCEEAKDRLREFLNSTQEQD